MSLAEHRSNPPESPHSCWWRSQHCWERGFFFWCDRLLYRRHSPPRSLSDWDIVEQLILLSVCWPAVMKLAHDMPMASHLGKMKMAKHILRWFYWPGIYGDVVEYYVTGCGIPISFRILLGVMTLIQCHVTRFHHRLIFTPHLLTSNQSPEKGHLQCPFHS